MITYNEKKKIFMVLVVLFVLLGVLIFTRFQRTTSEKTGNITTDKTSEKPLLTPTTSPMPTPTLGQLEGNYTISVSNSNIAIGDIVRADIAFTASGKQLAGSDVHLRFDPELLEANENLESGNYFSSFPRKQIDNQTGIIKVTGYNPVSTDVLSDNPVTFFVVEFKAKKSGTARISFDFQPGKTNLTTLVEKGTSRNILGKINEAALTIKP